MKKNSMICLMALLLCFGGCHKKEEATEPVDTGMVSIAQTDFTQAQAEEVLKKEVKEHCGSETACKVTSAKISGSDIAGTYTYEEDGKTVSAEVTLRDVTVNPKDPQIYSVGTSVFSGPAKQEESASSQSSDKPADSSSSSDKKESTASDIPKLPLPKEKLDPNKDEDTEFANVLKTDDYYVDRIYLFADGTLHVTGEFSGDGKFRFVVLNEDQSVAKDLINIKGSQKLDYEVKLKAGFYYLYSSSEGGSFQLQYNTTY